MIGRLANPFAVALVAVAHAFPASATESGLDTTSITGSFAPAKPVKRENPRYPTKAVAGAMGGWVRASFCVEPSGAVADVIIKGSSRAGGFEPNVLAALPRWRYQPAQFRGQPIRQCGLEVLLQFEMPGAKGVRAEFMPKWQAIVSLVTNGQLDEAATQIDALESWNNYEEARLDVLRAYIARARGDSTAELRAWNAALSLPGNLEPALLANALHRVFALNLQAKQLATALANYRSLEATGAQTDAEREAVKELTEAIRGPAMLVTPGLMDENDERQVGAAVWRVPLLRTAFGFHDVNGNVARVEVRCADHGYVGPFAIDQTWNIPLSWGACSLYVHGDGGATLNLIEYPAENGQPSQLRTIDP